VSSSGWPYVQFRGGPPGFVHSRDEHTIAWADFRGNRQYISTGNIAGDERVSLFFMDYPNRLRLKVFGRARTLDARDAPDVVAELAVPGCRASATVPASPTTTWPQLRRMRTTSPLTAASSSTTRIEPATRPWSQCGSPSVVGLSGNNCGHRLRSAADRHRRVPPTVLKYLRG
jgi:hypothetical protein